MTQPPRVGIDGAGIYVPRFRITAEAFADAWGRFQAAGIAEKAVPGADEDALTMAAAAGRRAIDAAGVEPTAIDWLGFATTTPPFDDEDLTARLRAMLGLAETVPTVGLTDSTRAGTRALWAAMDAIAAGTAHRALLVAADAPAGEPDDERDHAAGAGAAGFVLSADAADAPARIVDRATTTDPRPGTRFRRPGETASEGLGITQYDRSAFLDAIGQAADGLEADAATAPDAVAIQAPDGKLPYRAAGRLGVDAAAIQAVATVHDLGDCGAASTPLTLANALDGERPAVLALGYGSGVGADAFAIAVDAPVPTCGDAALEGDTTITYPAYLRQRGVVTSGPPAGGGAYVSIPSWTRSLEQRYRRVAGRCPDCDALAFPPGGACPSCGSLEPPAPVSLPREATVEAATVISQGGAPPEFAEQQLQAGDYAALIVSFALDGEEVSVPVMGTGAPPDAFAIGDRVRTTIRRIYAQEGVVRYGFKVRPVA